MNNAEHRSTEKCRNSEYVARHPLGCRQCAELRPSIRTLDFGQGFYTTTNKEQAVNFAVKVYDRSMREGNTPKGKFISIYEADYEKMKRELDILRFESADGEWLDWQAGYLPRSIINFLSNEEPQGSSLCSG